MGSCGRRDDSTPGGGYAQWPKGSFRLGADDRLDGKGLVHPQLADAGAEKISTTTPTIDVGGGSGPHGYRQPCTGCPAATGRSMGPVGGPTTLDPSEVRA